MDTTARLIDTIFSFSRCMKDRMGVQMETAHLTMVQLHTLIFLAKKQKTMGDIAQFVQIELPSATSLVETLVKLGLAKRTADKSDKRKVVVSLTEKGQTLLKNAKKKREENMRAVLSLLPEDDRVTLLRILQQLMKGLDASYEK